MFLKFSATDSKSGSRVSEVVEAESMPALINRLKSEGYEHIRVLPVTTTKRRKREWVLPHRVSGKELKIVTRQLAVTLAAGFMLTEALESIAGDLENTYFSRIIHNIKEDVSAGTIFSAALAKYPKIFSKSYVAIIKSGEATGWLHKTLANLAQYLENNERLREKVKASVSYPLFVLFFAIFIVTVIVVFIIPRFEGMFSQLNAELPLITRLLVGTSEFLIEKTPFILIGLFLLTMFVLLSLRFKKVQYLADALILKIPLVGKEIIHKSLIARFCRTLGFLISGGVSLSTSLNITSEITKHCQMQDSIQAINEHIVAGGMISEQIKTQPLFPNLVYKMVLLGERVGKLDEMLNRTADYYEEEIEFSLQKLTALLEPALIVFVGGLVFVIVVALYLPIFRISELIK